MSSIIDHLDSFQKNRLFSARSVYNGTISSAPKEEIKFFNSGKTLFTTTLSPDLDGAIIDQKISKNIDLDQFLTVAPCAQFLILFFDQNEKKTNIFTKIENHGFRLSIDQYDRCLFFKPRMMPEILNATEPLNSDYIQKILIKSRLRLVNLSSDLPATPCLIPAPDLLTPERFDIAFKALYARLWKNKMAQVWAQDVYKEHILRVAGPDGVIAEHDGSGKNGLDHFIKSFQSLITNTDPLSIPAVPVDINRIAFDGAHRIAAGLTMSRPVYSVMIGTDKPNPYHAPASFFARSVQGHPPCDPIMIDEAAIEYCRVKKGLAIALIFPVAGSPDYALQELKKISKIVYYKSIPFTPQMGATLLHQVYLGHDWMNPEKNSDGFIHKQKSCFPFSGPLHVILIDEFDPKHLRATKNQIRLFYGQGHHTLHITDSDVETLRTARLLFNQNSIDFMRAGIHPSASYDQLLSQYKEWIDIHQIDPEHCLLGGSALLGLLNLRESKDLDFLFHGKLETLPSPPPLIQHHGSSQKFYPASVADLAGDPRLHGWYMDIKFCAPIVIKEMKKNRFEDKDQRDIQFLNARFKQNNLMILNHISVGLIKINAYGQRQLRRKIEMFKKPLRPLVRSLRSYFKKNK